MSTSEQRTHNTNNADFANTGRPLVDGKEETGPRYVPPPEKPGQPTQRAGYNAAHRGQNAAPDDKSERPERHKLRSDPTQQYKKNGGPSG
ncbi:hypothetical protein FRB99_002458 [Tulasnella sp. 403]|nr:hypothetical protein FRB99_002458 [Tulasnella sp. 403]